MVEQLARANASLWNVLGGSVGLCAQAIALGIKATVDALSVGQ